MGRKMIHDLDKQIEAFDSRLERERSSREEQYEHYLAWCESQELDPEEYESEIEYEAYEDAMLESWAAEKAEQKAMDSYYFGDY